MISFRRVPERMHAESSAVALPAHAEALERSSCPSSLPEDERLHGSQVALPVLDIAFRKNI